MENPTPYGNQALQANQNFFGESTTIFNQEQQSQNQMWKTIGGAVAGVAAPFTGGASLLAGGLGNLDTTGGSSIREQIENFGAGLGGGTTGGSGGSSSSGE